MSMRQNQNKSPGVKCFIVGGTLLNTSLVMSRGALHVAPRSVLYIIEENTTVFSITMADADVYFLSELSVILTDSIIIGTNYVSGKYSFLSSL